MKKHLVFSRKIVQMVLCAFLLTSVVVLCVPKTYASDINLNDGLVGYWNFDEDDDSSIAFDRSGNGNDGTLMNGPTREEGKIGKAMRFDGVDDYVGTMQPVGVTGKEVTVSFWMKTQRVRNLFSGNQGGIFDLATKMVTGFNQTQIMIMFNYLGWSRDDPSGGVGAIFVASSDLITDSTISTYNRYDDDVWHLVTVVFDRNKGSFFEQTRFYIDGISVASKNRRNSGTVIPKALVDGFLNGYVSIGSLSASGRSYFFPGLLDEFRIYNRALSEEEIEALQDSYSDPSTLTVTVPLESTTTLRNFIPIEFTVKTSLFPKRTPDGLFSNKMRVQLDDRFPITIRYDRDEEDEDDGITYSIWKGVYNKPKGVSNIPFHVTGVLEMANCDKNTGEKIPFNIQQETRGTYTIQKTLQDDEIVTKTDFISLETPTPLPVECPSFFQKPISFLGCFFFGYSSEEPSLAETETATAYASIDEDDETMSEARARKLCKKPVGIFTCGTSSVMDDERNVYKTVQIGTQCWMATNMNVGTRIAGASSQTNNGIIEKYCFGDNENNCVTDGGLYLWDEAMQYDTTEGARGICPAGWHIPRNYEFYILENYLKDDGQNCNLGLYGNDDCIPAGTKLRTGTAGMTIPLTGYRYVDGSFNATSRGATANIWSSSDRVVRTYGSGPGIARNSRSAAWGFSARCLKD